MNRATHSMLVVGVVLLSLFGDIAVFADNEPDRQVISAFKDFADTQFTLDYPYRGSGDMTKCLQQEDCGPLYFRAMTSLDKLFSLPRMRLLDDVLWMIEFFCMRDKDEWAGNHCASAIDMLYFFDSEKEDDVIFPFVSHASAELKNKLFDRHFVWLKARPKKEKWLQFIRDDKQLSPEIKSFTVNYLEKSRDDYKETFEFVKQQYHEWGERRKLMPAGGKLSSE